MSAPDGPPPAGFRVVEVRTRFGLVHRAVCESCGWQSEVTAGPGTFTSRDALAAGIVHVREHASDGSGGARR